MKSKFLTAFIIVIIITGLYFIGKVLIEPNYGDDPKNPYDLNLDSIGKISKEKYGNYSYDKIVLNLKETIAISIAKDDKIYVSGDKKIQVFNSTNNFLFEFPIDITATSITISDDNKLYLGLKDHVEIYDINGNFISKWENFESNAYITSLAANKNVYVADAENEIVYICDKSGGIIEIIGDSVPSNSNLRFVLPSFYFDLDIDPDGFLWIANTGKHKMVNVNKFGEIRSYWGESSSEVEGFCGCCNPTHFAFLDDGSVITSEKGIIRIKKYNAAGKFVCAIAGPEHFMKGSEGLDIAVNSKQTIYVLEPDANIIHIFNEN